MSTIVYNPFINNLDFIAKGGPIPIPPTVATSYVTDNGIAVPALNILLVKGKTSTENNTNGIIAKGGVAGTGTANEVDVVLTNRIIGTLTTTDATPTTALTFPLGAVASTYFFSVSIVAFEALTPAGAGYETYTTIRTSGAAGTIIGDTDTITHEDPALATTNAIVTVSVNNAIVQITGVAGLTIDWVIQGTYVRVA